MRHFFDEPKQTRCRSFVFNGSSIVGIFEYRFSGGNLNNHNSKNSELPLAKSCDILRQYCRFIEIVELNFDKWHPKRSFQKAIEQAMEEGVLVDYLDRKSREVSNMLCAQYSYKMDIAVKKEEAFKEGVQRKAVEDARSFYANGASIELIAKSLNMTEEQVCEIVNAPIPVKV